MNFASETKVKDIALANPEARRILEDAGVDYCCGGDKSLHDACLHTDVPTEEILKRLHENTKQVSPDQENWTSASLNSLTQHIREKHHQYVRESIRRIQSKLEKVAAKHGEKHPEIADIQRLFSEIGREMIMHMQKEEQILFPYIDALEHSVNSNDSLEPPFFQTVVNPIQAMMKEHDSAGEFLLSDSSESNTGYDEGTRFGGRVVKTNSQSKRRVHGACRRLYNLQGAVPGIARVPGGSSSTRTSGKQ